MRKLYKTFFLVGFTSLFLSATAQQAIKPITELVNRNSMWDRVTTLASMAKNKVEILQRDSSRASKALVQSQLGTNTLLGSVIYNSGGILIDGGWVRILGSGSARLNRSVPDWNKGKLSSAKNNEPFYLLVADDVLGGLFAIKAESADELETIGQVFYYGPNGLSWQPTGLSYSSFISYCFSGNLKEFYEDFRWKGWQDEVKNIDCNTVVSCYPMLWTREGLQLKANRKLLAIQTQWNMYQGKSKSGSKQKSASAQRAPVSMQTHSSAEESMWAQSTSSR